jgi:hypothetical protein
VEYLVPKGEHRLLTTTIIIIIIIIITGTTALCEPWSSSGFLNNLIFTV